MGRKFTIISDQRALKFLLEQREVQPQFQKWLTKLLGYDFEILYQSGLQNKAADSLSQIEKPLELRSMSTTGIVNMEVVEMEVELDEDLKGIIEELKENPDESSKFQWINGNLLYKKRIVLSKKSSLIPTLLYTFHDSILGGHSRFLRTYKRMCGELYWKGMKADVKKYVGMPEK